MNRPACVDLAAVGIPRRTRAGCLDDADSKGPHRIRHTQTIHQTIRPLLGQSSHVRLPQRGRKIASATLTENCLSLRIPNLTLIQHPLPIRRSAINPMR